MGATVPQCMKLVPQKCHEKHFQNQSTERTDGGSALQFQDICNSIILGKYTQALCNNYTVVWQNVVTTLCQTNHTETKTI